MIDWLVKKKVRPMRVTPEDTILLRYYDGKGRSEVISHPVGVTASYDTIAIGRIENELGLEEGLVAVIGRE